MSDDAPSPQRHARVESDDTHGVDLLINRLTRRGHGLALLDDRPVFVPGVDVGERVAVTITERGRRLEGRVRRIHSTSPARREPGCPDASRCPGCQLRHLTDERQGVVALERVAALIHGATETAVDWTWIARAPRDAARSRVLARALTDSDGRLALGMAADGGGGVQLGGCPGQTPATRALTATAQADLRAAGFTAFDPRTREGTIRHVFAEASAGAARLVIALAHPVSDHRFDTVLADRPEVALAVDVLPKRGASTFSTPRPLRGHLSLPLTIDGDVLRATLPAWTPQAPDTIAALRRVVIRWLAPRATDHIVEIGCGVGTLSVPIARVVGRLTGIDRCRAAIDDATYNASIADIDGATFLVGGARHGLRRLLARGERADLVLLHAMRRPFGPAVMSAVRALGPRKVLYLAPNPAALADDLRALLRHGPENGTAKWRPATGGAGVPRVEAEASGERPDGPAPRASAPTARTPSRGGYALTRAGVVDQAPGTMELLCAVLLTAAEAATQPAQRP